MCNKRLFVIHGFMASPDNHWFPWLKEKASNLGIETFIPQMPSPSAPVLAEWLDTLANIVSDIDSNTFFIGHSLGCITILKYLETVLNKPAPIGLIMVSGFSESIPILPILDEFTKEQVDISKVESKITHKSVIASLDDEIVPTEYSLKLSQRLKAPFYGLPNSGHFLDQDGFYELDIVLEQLKSFMD